jgi:exodeoxyribonuclease VII small subunit
MDTLTYKKAMEEIELIIEKLEANKLDVDELGANVRRVAQLTAFCKAKLHDAEQEVENILRSMEQ